VRSGLLSRSAGSGEGRQRANTVVVGNRRMKMMYLLSLFRWNLSFVLDGDQV
jgi:hypothetical protein